MVELRNVIALRHFSPFYAHRIIEKATLVHVDGDRCDLQSSWAALCRVLNKFSADAVKVASLLSSSRFAKQKIFWFYHLVLVYSSLQRKVVVIKPDSKY